MVEIQSITFEHHCENGALGIGESCPRISWSFKGDAESWTQTSYDIVIMDGTDDESQARTFHTASSESRLVPWPAAPLKSRERVQIRVRSSGHENSDTTPWSKWALVEAGLLSRQDWTAKMIAAEKILSTTGSLRPMLFRNSFSISENIRRARLYVTCYGVYEAQINGCRVDDQILSPGWTSYKHHLNYQTFDVTSLLKAGENAIGVEVADGWYAGRLGFEGGQRFIYGDRLAVLVQLEVILQGGEEVTIASGPTWQIGPGPTVTAELYDGEEYDASLEVKNWSSSSFNDRKWTAGKVVDFPTAKIRSPEGPPVREIQRLKPQKIYKSPTGKTLVDFGQNLVGYVQISVKGPKGHVLTLTHTEVLENGEAATRPLRDCKATDKLILNGEQVSWKPKFTFHGFRYIQIENWPSTTGDPDISEIEAIVLHTDMQQTGWFECSDQMVNKLHDNIRWSMRGNFLHIPTDCPQRDERLGWTGDIQIFSPTANFLYNTSGILSGWLKDVAAETVEDEPKGIVPLVVPNVIPFTFPEAAWADAIVIVPWDLYKASGDTEFLRNQYESMRVWIDQGLPRQANGLWDASLHQLGDWLDPAAPPSHPGDSRTDPHFVANAYLVRITELMVQICNVLGFTEDEKKYTSDAKRLREAFQSEYITPAGRLAPDTMTSLSLAISFSLFPQPSHITNAAQRLATLVRKANFRIATGFAGTPLILPTLSRTNQTQLAYRMLLEKKCPSWLYPVTMGATTMWERWDSMLPNGSINPGSMTSFNHYALGSVAAWLHGTVGGLSPAEAGWKVVNFAPVPGGTITWAKTKFEGPYGRVVCNWRIEKGKFKMSLEVPPNSKGIIKMPSGKEEQVGSGTWEFEEDHEALEWPPEGIEDPFGGGDQ